MLEWINKHRASLITACLIGVMLVYGYGCESTTPSILNNGERVTRAQLEMELDRIAQLVEIKVKDLDRQDALKKIIFQNAVLLVQGNPTNPVGIITGIAALYGFTQGASNTVSGVKKLKEKRKVTNGQS